MESNEAQLLTPTAEICALLMQGCELGYIGEPVSQLQHVLQAAHHAERLGGRPEVVAAALLHDIGHLLPCGERMTLNGGSDLGVSAHERRGADYLRQLGLPEEVCTLVAGHVATKRFLSAQDPAYLNALSPASRQTLECQGGPMTAEEAKLYRSDPLFAEHLVIRQCDDLAKDPNFLYPKSLKDYAPLIGRLIRPSGL
jgi:predicted HD phosphohydrolase